MGRARRASTARAGGRGQGRDLHGAPRRAAGGRRLDRAVRRRRVNGEEGTAMDLELLTRKSDVGMVDRAARPDARARDPVRQRSAPARDGREGLRAGRQRGDAARDRARVLRHAGRALGLRVSDRRRRGVRRRSRRRRVCRRRRLRHLVRRADAAHRPDGRRRRAGQAEARRRTVAQPCRRASAASGACTSDAVEMDAMLTGGARWAVERGYGTAADLERIEEHGCMPAPSPARCPTTRRSGSATKWARSDPATTISKCSRSAKIFDARGGRRLSACTKAISSSASTAARAGSAIRSAPSS